MKVNLNNDENDLKFNGEMFRNSGCKVPIWLGVTKPGNYEVSYFMKEFGLSRPLIHYWLHKLSLPKKTFENKRRPTVYIWEGSDKYFEDTRLKYKKKVKVITNSKTVRKTKEEEKLISVLSEVFNLFTGKERCQIVKSRS